MTLPRRATAFLVIAGTLLVLGSLNLGGPIRAISTYGSSMEPTYSLHDLVLVHRTGDYAVGDVIAYHSDAIDRVVLHRIIDEHEGRFITRGDNNHWDDPDQPTSNDIIGEAIVALPQLGVATRLPTPVQPFLPLPVAMLLLGRSHRKNQRTTKKQEREDLPPGRVSPFAGTPLRLIAAATGLGVAGAVLAYVAWTRPTSQPEVIGLTQEASFDYRSGSLAPSPVYPDGKVDTGEPAFLRITDELDITLHWELPSHDVEQLEATGQLTALVEDTTGWSRTITLGEPSQWTTTEASLTGRLDLREVRQLGENLRAATGAGGGTQTVTITGDVIVHGELDGTRFNATFAPSMTLLVDELKATLAPSSRTDNTGPAIPAQTTTDEIKGTSQSVAHLDLAGVDMTVAAARAAGLTSLGVAIALLMAGTVLGLRSRRHPQDHLILKHHRRDIVHADTLSPAENRPRARLASFRDLLTIAQHEGLPIVRVPLRTRGHGYVVDHPTCRYSFVPPPADPPQDQVPDST